METRRAKLQQQQQQKVLEKQSPWVLATPAMPITPEERPRTSKCFLSSDDHARDVKSRDTATSSRPNEVQYHNVGSHRSTLVNPTTGFPQIYIGNVLVLTDPVEIQNVASFSPSVLASVVGSKDQTLSLLNGKLLPSGNFCHGGNHPHNGIAVGYHPNLNFDPEEAACTSTADTVPVPLAPVTPAKGREINDPMQHETNKAVEKELTDMNRKEAGKVQCYAIVHHDFPEPVVPASPNKGKASEDHPREVINLVGMEPTRDDENAQERDQCLKHSPFKRGTSSPDQGFKPVIEQDEERSQGRNESSTRKKKATRKKHRPKVLKDGLLTSKKPVTPRTTSKNENQTGKRSYVRKKKSLNCANTPSDMTREANKGTNTVWKSANQDPENGTKFVRRRLDFEFESQTVDEYLEPTFTKSESQATGRRTDTAANSRAKLTVQLGQGVEVEVEESEVGIALDLNRSLNQVLDEYIRLPENPTPPLKPSRRELLKKNWKYLARKAANATNIDNPNFVEASKLKNVQNQIKFDGDTETMLMQDDVGDNRDKCSHDLVDNAQSCYSYPTSSDEYFMQPRVSNIPQFPQECKRRRTGKGYDGEFCQMIRQDSKLFSSAEEQKLIQTDKLQAQDFIWALGQTKRATKRRSKIPIRARKSVFNVMVTGCDQLLGTPESQHQVCKEALYADTHIRMKTGKRTRKRRVHLKSLSNIDHEHDLVHFLGQESAQLTSLSGNLQETNFHDLQIIPIQECRHSSNILGPFCTCLMSQAIVPYIDQTDMHVAAEPQYSLVSYSSSMMVPYTGIFSEIKKKRSRAKVDLDEETNRVWKLLMGKIVTDAEGSDMDREKQWQEERQVFRGRADSFIARMHLIQGDRRFSQWKGSVLDSVIGVFLTQNVSDHLSSSAFMALAAKFPLKERKENAEQDAKSMSTQIEEYGSTPSFDDPCYQGKVLDQKEYEHGSFFIYDIGDEEETKMNKANESTRTNPRDDDLDSFGGEVVNVQRREPEESPVMPDNRAETSITIKANSESEDKRTLDDARSSPNSLSPSEESSNYLSQKENFVGSGPQTLLDTDLRYGTMVSGLDGYASCQEHIQNSGANTMQEIYNYDNDGIMLAEKCGGVDQKYEKKRTIDELNSLRDSCKEISCKSNSQLDSLQHDSAGVPSVAFESSDSDNMKNVDLVRMKSISSLLFSNPGNTNTDNIIDDTNRKESFKNSTESASQQSLPLISNVTMTLDICPSEEKHSLKSHVFSHTEATSKFQQNKRKQDCQVEKTQHEVEFLAQKGHCQPQKAFVKSCDDVKGTSKVIKIVEPNSKVEVCSPQEFPTKTSKGTPRTKKTIAESEKAKAFDWDSLRKEACHNGYASERSKDRMDSLDWESVRCSDVREISETIRERGMNNVLAERIKAFLNRLVRDHGSLDLEWLREIPPDKAKEYLLSIQGLGLKSVECVRLLTLHQHAFPVDTNVGRICVRLGWVPLQPLPESIQLHLLEMYPVMETIQKYLWPRLCTLDQRTLYELHYQMITFGKVFCTKSKPNCNACPMRGECKHFASAFASARLALPGPEERRLVKSTLPNASGNDRMTIFNPMPLHQIQGSSFLQGNKNNNEPLIEEPPSPEPECHRALESEIEEGFYEDPDEIPTINLNLEEFTQNLQNYMQENMELQDGDIEKALVAVTREVASIPMPKLKNVSRLRTEHQVYELPDSHPLLEGIEPREPDDPCPYLLSIWAPGETANSTQPQETRCNSQDTGKLCEDITCFACSCRKEEQAQTVRGTLLIPCRTANRGSFPLNGTYFQVNEVFADHQSSHNPIVVSRKLIWNLSRRTVYFGTSIPTLFKGLTTDEIQLCFWRGFVCLRGIDRETRAPRPLSPRLHLAASHMLKDRKTPEKEEKKATKKTTSKS